MPPPYVRVEPAAVPTARQPLSKCVSPLALALAPKAPLSPLAGVGVYTAGPVGVRVRKAPFKALSVCVCA